MSATLTIDPKPIDPSSADFTITVDDVTYDGTNHDSLNVVVKDGNNTLTNPADYTWEKVETTTIDAGTYNITITGHGNYSGTVNKE